jgi:ATP-dependent Clp protease, protease subunit
MFNLEQKGKALDIYLYDIIGNFMGEGVSAKQFAKALEPHADVEQINLYINSPGGIVWDGVSIYNILKRHKANVTAYVDGLAASIASLILQAGDTRVIAEGALVMLHKPWSFVVGNSQAMLNEAIELDKIEDSLVDIYVKRSGKSAEDVKAFLKGEDGADGTYFDSSEAQAAGLVDSISEAKKQAALDSSMLDKFDWTKNIKSKLTVSEAEEKEKIEDEKQETENKQEQQADAEVLAKLDSIINTLK